MMILICLWWICIQLSAPGWIYALLVLATLTKVIDYGLKMYNHGLKDKL